MPSLSLPLFRLETLRQLGGRIKNRRERNPRVIKQKTLRGNGRTLLCFRKRSRSNCKNLRDIQREEKFEDSVRVDDEAPYANPRERSVSLFPSLFSLFFSVDAVRDPAPRDPVKRKARSELVSIARPSFLKETFHSRTSGGDDPVRPGLPAESKDRRFAFRARRSDGPRHWFNSASQPASQLGKSRLATSDCREAARHAGGRNESTRSR